MLRSGNPTLNDKVFQNVQAGQYAKAMTIEGSINKTFFLLLICMVSALYTWSNPEKLVPLFLPLVIGTLVIALLTVFKKEWAGFTAPLYAFLEGLILGGISAMMERSYPGIAFQAIALTFGVLFCMLIAYRFRIIQATKKFYVGVFAATGAIALLYLTSMVMGFFGTGISFINSSTPIGIGFSVVVVIIAALNLIIDFDCIEKGARGRLPEYMEWYGAFALMVTLIWLYMEILRLLSKLKQK